MARKPLDAEEIAELRSNPYVASIISGRISFTPEFKRVAYDQLMKGKSMRMILEVLLTDITYLFFKNGKCYLSTILDAFTHEVLAFRVSLSFKVDFVLETTDRLIAEHGSTLDNETIVHSGQTEILYVGIFDGTIALIVFFTDFQILLSLNVIPR